MCVAGCLAGQCGGWDGQVGICSERLVNKDYKAAIFPLLQCTAQS
jgi:hypothetical protein